MYNGVINIDNLDKNEILELLEACDELCFDELIDDLQNFLIKEEKEYSLTSLNQQYTTAEESEEDLLPAESDSSLEKSVWAPNRDRCERKGNIKAKVAAIKVLGNNANYKERSLRWSIRWNIHLKEITEKFERGNLWYILNFDYKKGYEEARIKLENKKEDYEQAKLILEKNVDEDKDTGNWDKRISN